MRARHERRRAAAEQLLHFAVRVVQFIRLKQRELRLTRAANEAVSATCPGGARSANAWMKTAFRVRCVFNRGHKHATPSGRCAIHSPGNRETPRQAVDGGFPRLSRDLGQSRTGRGSRMRGQSDDDASSGPLRDTAVPYLHAIAAARFVIYCFDTMAEKNSSRQMLRESARQSFHP